MDWFEALILGLLQGFTEFLPVSSSGHLEIGKSLFSIDSANNLTFTIVVHGATVLSTIVVFINEIIKLLTGFLKFKWNPETKYIIKIGISIIPVAILGYFFKDYVESFYNGNIVFVGIMLCITALLLAMTHFLKNKRRKRDIGFFDAFIIGISQAFAKLPGISRIGFTFATGLLIGNKKLEIARFSFLMVLIPIIAGNLFDLFSGNMISDESLSPIILLIGFISAFVSGFFACKWMINIIIKGKLVYFAIYCLIIGFVAILTGLI